MATGRIIIGSYEPYPTTQQGQLIIGSYEPYPTTQWGKVIVGYYEPYPWLLNFVDTITVAESFLGRLDRGFLSQLDLSITAGHSYQLDFDVSGLSAAVNPTNIIVRQGTQSILTFTMAQPGSKSVVFTANGSGNRISFEPSILVTGAIIDNVRLREFLQAAVDDNIPVKEFLTGNTDENKEIFFRADTQPIHLIGNFETFSTPLAIATRLQRGTMMKCFVAIEDDNFYELEGTVSKGVSIVKVNSKNKGKIPTPPLTRQIRISWRDGSKQLCRLMQSAIIFSPGTMDYTE